MATEPITKASETCRHCIHGLMGHVNGTEELHHYGAIKWRGRRVYKVGNDVREFTALGWSIEGQGQWYTYMIPPVPEVQL